MINQGSSFFPTKEEPFLSSGGSTFMFQASPSVRQIVGEGGGWGWNRNNRNKPNCPIAKKQGGRSGLLFRLPSFSPFSSNSLFFQIEHVIVNELSDFFIMLNSALSSEITLKSKCIFHGHMRRMCILLLFNGVFSINVT